MKAVVLAGGYATRLWPITRHRPKMLLPLAEGTVIDRCLSALSEDDRIDDVFLSTNRRFRDAFETFLEDRRYPDTYLSVEETVSETEKMGVIGALAQLVDREGIDDDLLVVGGDNLFSFEIGDFLDFYETKGHPIIAAYDVGSREAAKAYGLVTLDGDRIVDFQEKPEDPDSTLVSIACYAFPADRLPLLDQYLAGDNNPDEPGWFIQWLQAREAVSAFSFDGTWFDIGTPASYLDAVEWSLSTDAAIDPEATLENTTVGETVLVQAQANVRNASLERTVVFEDATVHDATLSNSLVDTAATIDGVDLHGSRVGAHSRVTDR